MHRKGSEWGPFFMPAKATTRFRPRRGIVVPGKSCSGMRVREGQRAVMVRRLTTKELIGASFHELAASKPVDKITVKEVADNCGVSTTTFYNHFRDKYELIAWMYDHKIDRAFAAFKRGEKDWKGVLSDFATILNDDRDFYVNTYRHLGAESSPFSTSRLHSVDLLRDAIRTIDPSAGDEVMFDAALYLRGVSGCITEWFDRGLPGDADKLVGWMYNAVPDALKPYLWRE